MSRYVAGVAGKNHDQSNNYAVSDTMPGVGSDGHVADCKSLEQANKIAQERNFGFSRLSAMMEKNENRSWQSLGNGFYAFLTIPENKKPFYID